MSDGMILTIEQRKKISMTAVKSVDSFSEERIKLTLEDGRVTIDGNKLKILSFSQGSGAFSAAGEVRSVQFGGAKGKALGLFK